MSPIDAGELAAALPAANLAVLVAAVAHLTGDLSMVDAHGEPRTFDHGRGPGSVTDADADAIRAWAFDALTTLPSRARRPPTRTSPSCTGCSSSSSGSPSVPSTCRWWRRRPTSTAPTAAASSGRDRPGADDARRLPRRHHRRRSRRALRGDPPGAGGDPVHGVRQERRRRRHLVREHLPRPARRRAQPLLLVLVPPNPDWSHYYARAARAARLRRRVREGAPRAAARAPRHRGGVGRRGTRRARARGVSSLREADGASRRSRSHAIDQRGRDAEPSRGSRHRRPRHVRGPERSTRRAGTTTSTSTASGSS